MTGTIALRPIEDSDLDGLFDQMRDPESVRMAAFTPDDPDDRDAFDAKLARIRAAPDTTLLAITRDGELVGSIGSFVVDGDTEITYWIARSAWGQGIASRAVALLLETVPIRPLHARAASDNRGSLKVLRRAGFSVVGTEVAYANARRTEIEESILRLDATTPAGELADRARDWAGTDSRVSAAFVYGSVASGRSDEWSDLDLLVVTEDGSRESLWADRADVADRILGGGGAVSSGELGWQRPYRYAAYRADAVQLDLTIDEGTAKPWRGLADGFVALFDRAGLAERLRTELDGWRPPAAEAEPNDGSTWVWLKYLAGRLRRGQLWMVRCGLPNLSYDRILPLLGVSPNEMETVLSAEWQRRLRDALPTSNDRDELARALRTTAELYADALDDWSIRTSKPRPEHALAPVILERLRGL